MLAVGALIVLLIVQQQQLIKLPGSGRFADALPDALHGSWFACVTWVVLLFVARWTRRDAAIAVTVLIGLCIAVGTELLQKITGGDAELGDVFFDMFGLAAALCFWCARQKMIAPRLGVGLAIVLLVGSLGPGLRAVLIERYRDSIAPELVRFDSSYTGDLIGSSSAVEVVSAPEGWSIEGPVLRVTLADDIWPGVHLEDPIADWRAYSELDIDAFVEGSAPMPITVSVRIDHVAVDHVYRQFRCAPGPCRLQLPFADLFDREVARVNAVVIFSTRANAGRVFYLGRVALRA